MSEESIETHKVTNRPDVIKSNYDIYVKLFNRCFNELGLSNIGIAEDAKKQGRQISDTTLSKYWNQFDDKKKCIKESVQSNLSQDNLLWLCKRHGIDVNMQVTVLPMNEAPYYIETIAKKNS